MKRSLNVPVGYIVKAMEWCNLMCRRCYYYEYMTGKNSKNTQTGQAIVSIAQKVAAHNKQFNQPTDSCLHGGEPGLLGLKALREIVDELHKIGSTVSMVTNLAFTKLNDPWLELLRTIDNLGISLNGDFQGNSNRIFRNGKPSFGLVTRNIRALQETRTTNYGIICTVTKENVSSGQATVKFLHQLSSDVKILPMDCPDFPPEELATFLIDALTAFIEIDDENFRLSSVDEGLRVLDNQDPVSCVLGRKFKCHHQVTIKLNGDVLPCDSSHELYQVAGNVFEQSLTEILIGAKWQDLMQQFRRQKKAPFCCAATRGVYSNAWQKYLEVLGKTLQSIQ